MKEAKFNSELVGSLKEAGAWAWKIPDQPASWTYRRTRFTPEKPFDIIFQIQGRFGAIESKQMKKFEAFGLRDFRESQIRNLNRIVATGGRAFAFLNVRIIRPYENRMIIFDWEELYPAMLILPYSAKEIRDLPYITGAKDRFNLQPFLKNILL